MDDKLMYIPNDDKQNYPFYRFKLLVDKFELKKIQKLQGFWANE